MAKYSPWSDQICLPLALSIGTVALRKQAINAYLTMLGFGLTPQSSPVPRQRNALNSNEAAGANATPTGQSRVFRVAFFVWQKTRHSHRETIGLINNTNKMFLG